jgi:hypothetical protein
MNFKTTALGLATVAGLSLNGGSAQALSLGSQLDTIWFADSTPTSIEFYTNEVGPSGLNADPVFSTPIGQNVGYFFAIGKGAFPAVLGGLVKDLPSLSGPVDNFLYFGENSPFNFNLKSITFDDTVVGSLSYRITGLFGDGTPGSGVISTQTSIVGTAPIAWSGTFTAVPTPALLPGLVAMGLGILRKRKAQVSE